LRVSVIQSTLDIYLRKQKLTFDELAGAISEPMSTSQRIEPEKDLITTIRRIPKNVCIHLVYDSIIYLKVCCLLYGTYCS
jgi:glutamate-1-semialdehyde aminotransferase